MTPSPVSAPDDTSALWLATFQRAVGRASHDVKDAINGVSVNLEVVRSRAARPDAPASAVSAFAEAAAQQLERLTTLIEAVLALGRPERERADVAVTLRRVVVICGASSSAVDAAVELAEEQDDTSTVTSVRDELVRLALTAPLLEAVAGAGESSRASTVRCTLGADDDAVLVTMRAEGRRITMPEPLQETMRGAGIRWDDAGHDLSLAFPRA